MTPEDLFTPTQAAKVLGVSPATLKKWRRLRKRIRYVKVGTRCYYRPSDLAAYQAKHVVEVVDDDD